MILILGFAGGEFHNLVSGSTTFDGRNHVWVKPPNPDVRVARASKQAATTYDRLEAFME